MTELAKHDAGAEVKIHMYKRLCELPADEGGMREIGFRVMDVGKENGDVVLDGWTV